MTASAERLREWDEQLLAVAGPVRRVAAARLTDPHAVDDVVQETLVRLLAARDRLDASALLPYAIVTARNLIHEHGRSLDRHRRHAHRVLDTREPDRPEDVVLQQEEQAAIAAALDNLPESDRRMLLAHEVEKVDTAALAVADGTTAGGVAAQLARARAKLRAEYVLALRRAELPTVRCRPVLLPPGSAGVLRQRPSPAALPGGGSAPAGQRVSFAGDIMVRTSPGFAAAAGVPASEGAAQLLAQGAHIRAASSVVTVSRH
jgi:RNA polymerase sigma factor (sigma-70 family)